MTTEWTNEQKTGWGWDYNQPVYTYDQEEDPTSGLEVYYNSVGLPTEWDNQIRS